MSSIEKLARTIADLAVPDMQPGDLFKAVRERHPKALKKEIRSAAFYSLILVAEASPLKVAELHDLALRTRRDRSGDGD